MELQSAVYSNLRPALIMRMSGLGPLAIVGIREVSCALNILLFVF